MSRLLVRTRDFSRCVRCKTPLASGAGEWHHRRSRSVRDECQHASCNGILLCGTCHAWVHAHPFAARAKGWIVSRFAKPCEVPVFAEQHGWVLLDHKGNVMETEPTE